MNEKQANLEESSLTAVISGRPQIVDFGKLKEDEKGKTRVKRWPLYTDKCINLYREWGVSVKRNTCTDDIVKESGEVWNDVDEAILLGTLRDFVNANNYSITDAHAKRALIRMADDQQYHPVKDYLTSLKWDGVDHIERLIAHFDDPGGHFDLWFRHWIVGAVAKVFDGHQNPMLVLVGDQGGGKSFFANWLCPPQLTRSFYAGSIDPDSKDCRLRQREIWLWEVEELGATTKRADLASLKAFLTTAIVRDRKPYGRRDCVKLAISSFIGTINAGAGFLIDMSGNRRFLVSNISRIDWNYASCVSRDGLWAQAVTIYHADQSWMLDENAVEVQRETNAEAMVENPLEDLLESLLDFTGKQADFLSTVEILDALRAQSSANQALQATVTALVLKKWGAEKCRSQKDGKRVRGYRGVRRTADAKMPF